MDEQPPNIIEAPFQCVDIRTKTEAAWKASLKSITDRDAAKLARRRLAPRRPTVPTASRNRPTANYTPPFTADHMHTEGESRPPKIAWLMSLTIHAPEKSPPPYTPASTYYYVGYYDRPLPENRKRRFGKQARQPTSGCYRPRYQQTRGGTASGSVRSDTVGRATLPSRIEDAGSAANGHTSLRSQSSSLA